MSLITEHASQPLMPDPGCLVQEYIATKLQPTLVKALTVLAHEKPTSNKLDAVTFLANWLLENNPNKPQTQVPPELQQQIKQQQAEREAAAAAQAAAVAAAARQAGSSGGKTQTGRQAVQVGLQWTATCAMPILEGTFDIDMERYSECKASSTMQQPNCTRPALAAGASHPGTVVCLSMVAG